MARGSSMPSVTPVAQALATSMLCTTNGPLVAALGIVRIRKARHEPAATRPSERSAATLRPWSLPSARPVTPEPQTAAAHGDPRCRWQ
eukprot:5063360-Pyramimonas_sp.AAC.1